MRIQRLAVSQGRSRPMRDVDSPLQSHTTARSIQHCTFRSFTNTCPERSWRLRAARRAPGRMQPPSRYIATKAKTPNAPPNLQKIHMRCNELCASALRPEDRKVPSEQRILYVLEQLEALAKSLESQVDMGIASSSGASAAKQSATSALLGSVNTKQTHARISKVLVLNSISAGAEQILRHPDVFMTPSILKAYVDLQCLLQRPSSFPDIFALYARKAIPKQDRVGRITYKSISPRSVRHPSSAIPAGIASTALDSAIASHDLALAIDVIETTYATPSFRNAKIIREAGLPLTGAAALPFAVWALSSQIGYLSPALSHSAATNMAFAGFMTYFGAVGTLGYITIATSNDQMDRVTWAEGLPLWERWVRENERAAIDRLAGAWGFKNYNRRGEEEGEEWDFLREWIGMRGMILDRVSLMEGME